MGYFYISMCLALTVYGQVILKWRINQIGEIPDGLPAKLSFFATAFSDLYVWSGLAAAILASGFWMAAISKFDLNHAYPFMSSAFVLVLVLSHWLFGESITGYKVAGVILIVSGIAVSGMST